MYGLTSISGSKDKIKVRYSRELNNILLVILITCYYIIIIIILFVFMYAMNSCYFKNECYIVVQVYYHMTN